MSVTALILSLCPLVGIYIAGPLSHLSFVDAYDFHGLVLLIIFYLLAPVSSITLASLSFSREKARYTVIRAITSIIISAFSLSLAFLLFFIALLMTP